MPGHQRAVIGSRIADPVELVGVELYARPVEQRLERDAAAAVLVVSGGLLALSNIWGRPGAPKPAAATSTQVIPGLRAGGSTGLFVPAIFPQQGPRIREIAV